MQSLCSKCGLRPKAEYSSSWCQPCSRESCRAYYQAHKAKANENSRLWRLANPEKAREAVRKSQRKSYAENPEPELQRCREWRANNPEKVKEINRKSKAKRKARDAELLKVWRENNKEHLRAYRAERNKRPHVRVLNGLRTRLVRAMKGIAKSASTLALLGCTVEHLRAHLESKFRPGMTWENYGQWHVDHVRPCASFDLTDLEQQRQCFHYTNLQPLWAQENRSKSARWG